MLILKGATYTPPTSSTGSGGNNNNDQDPDPTPTPTPTPDPTPTPTPADEFEVYFLVSDTWYRNPPEGQSIETLGLLVSDSRENEIESISFTPDSDLQFILFQYGTAATDWGDSFAGQKPNTGDAAPLSADKTLYTSTRAFFLWITYRGGSFSSNVRQQVVEKAKACITLNSAL